LTKTELSPELSPDYDPNVPSYPYDPAKARALLDQAGWHVGARGIRVKGGQRFAFTYGTQTESQTGRAIETYVQNAWHQLGADVSVKNQPTAQFFDNTTNGVLQGGHYDVAGFTWIAASDPDDSPIYSPRNLAPSGQNALFWNDPIVARAMEAELATVDRSNAALPSTSNNSASRPTSRRSSCTTGVNRTSTTRAWKASARHR